jgi:hypothetical protein
LDEELGDVHFITRKFFGIKMENLPQEILGIEIGKYLDVSGLIAISLVNKKMMAVYQPRISLIIRELDPFAFTTGDIHQLLGMLRIGTVDNVIFKMWHLIYDQIITEMRYFYPYITPDKINELFVHSVPSDAIVDLKNKMIRYIGTSNIFLVYRNVVYKNYWSIRLIDIRSYLETDIVDIIDPLLHELSDRSDNKQEDQSASSSTTEEEYFIYENIMDALETYIRYL